MDDLLITKFVENILFFTFEYIIIQITDFSYFIVFLYYSIILFTKKKYFITIFHLSSGDLFNIDLYKKEWLELFKTSRYIAYLFRWFVIKLVILVTFMIIMSVVKWLKKFQNRVLTLLLTLIYTIVTMVTSAAIQPELLGLPMYRT